MEHMDLNAEGHWHLSQGLLQDKLSQSYYSKQLCLVNIWSARETNNENYVYLINNQSNAIENKIQFRYDQWREK